MSYEFIIIKLVSKDTITVFFFLGSLHDFIIFEKKETNGVYRYYHWSIISIWILQRI